MTGDWVDATDEAWVAFRQEVIADMVPKLTDSSIVFSLVPNDHGDVKFWVELGAAIMFDKPIVCVVEPGREVPERLRKVADKVLEADLGTEEGQQAFSEALALIAPPNDD